MNLISVEERQMMRLQTIRKFCKSDLYRDMGYNSEALEDTHLSKKVTLFRKFGAFECRVAKTGTSTRGKVFYPLFHNNQTMNDPNYHPSNDDDVPKLAVSRFRKRKLNLMFGFMFTRDPFDRAVSAYFNRVIPNLKMLNNYESLNNFLLLLATTRSETVSFVNQNLDLNVVKQFLWQYRYDYIVFGYNPHNALKKIERIVGRKRPLIKAPFVTSSSVVSLLDCFIGLFGLLVS
ncbi:uncharacterized protein LOC142340309 [Convolutriloba macropyga]|uniref:uncharacterized protein LOC142340309 n=1 Tax=Convolutriloba macropyga TaxID=536237 RepID=UPI003F521C94